MLLLDSASFLFGQSVKHISKLSSNNAKQRLSSVLRNKYDMVFALPFCVTETLVVFHGLDKGNIANIAKILLKNLSDRLAKVDMQLEVSDAALNKIAEVGFDPTYGARPLKRAIQQHIENPVSKMILEGKFGPKDVVPVDVDKKGDFSFTRQVH